jgi:four helix bundle protein
MPQFENKYDLETRTTQFSSELIIFCRSCPKDIITIPLINQLIRSGTSIGANYREANGGSSKKDFQNKIFICKKESKETLYWLELIGKSAEDVKIQEKARKLWQEAKEFILIFGKIAYSTKQ